MKRFSFVAIRAVALVVMLFSGDTRTAEAVTCSPMELIPCFDAIISSTPPSDTCCSKLKEQIPCLCGYLNDPTLKRFLTIPTLQGLLALVELHILLSVKSCLIRISIGCIGLACCQVLI
ncbi:hypothetical protein CRYUN_Cryun28dG0017600 [Craigia yunnanensis]